MISAALLPEFVQEMANTRKLLACLPEGKWDWRPHPKSMPLGRLAGHLAQLPGWATNTIKLDVLDLTPEGKPPQPFLPQSTQEVLRTFDDNVVEARAAIEGASDEHLAVLWSLIFFGNKVLTLPRSAVLRSVVMNHLIHHRAQLGLYLRLNDVAIPGMYGPSADDGPMFAGH